MELILKNVSKKLSKNFSLNNVNFSIKNGEVLGLIGNNGAGKTTIIKSIFKEYRLDQGEILVNGKSISKYDLRKIEFFPDQNNFPKNFKIIDYCYHNYLLSNIDGNKKQFKIRFKELSESLELLEYKNKKFLHLSSGMQKRFLLLCALMNKPEMIICDEPMANMDIQTRKDFILLFKKLIEKFDLIVLITSHDIEELEKLINKVVLVDKGEIILEKNFNNKKDNLAELYEKNIRNPKSKIKVEEILKGY
ncbi:ABC transporter ATP-binding protein [Entomoplasma ellychniae]|uniref:ABC transporter ATP-binding protein n=1 Tax=Entomoplasma ellychniae TaxID=2114 RepID=A0A8E2QY44_9MOLU|nr:ATP-binding cassette domain-containing protein [Entomoplasma ellychniae]PPE04730.1 ABC transporter ATP-binding protein [Entomoplasma ellychniae]